MGSSVKTKAELVARIHATREKLNKKISILSPEQMVWPGSMDDWSVKDILAHLVDWEQRFIKWYQQGLCGEKPQTPAPGMTWRDLPKLNKMFFEKHKDESLEYVLEQYEKSFKEILNQVESMQEREIFEKGYYDWTGKYPLLVWIDANTASHYDWAHRNIRTKVITSANLHEKPVLKKRKDDMREESVNGAVVYVKDLLPMNLFYQHTINLSIVNQETDFIELKKGNFELLLVKMPDEIASELEISTPPSLREDSPIKLIFQVDNMAAARDKAERYGGHINTKEQEWRYLDFQVCDGYDPEGNIIQLRQAIQK